MISAKVAAVFLCLLVFLGMTTFTEATVGSLECDKKWKQPKASNDIMECISDAERLQTDIWVAVVLVLPILAIFVVVICWPCAFYGRLCCGICGSNRRRPGGSCCCGGKEWDKVGDDIKAQNYPRRYVKKIKTGSFVLFLLSIGGILVMTIGARKLHDGYNYGMGAVSGIVDFLDEVMISVKTYATLESGEFIPPLSADSFEAFSNVTNSFRDFITETRADFDPLVNQAHSILVFVALLPALLLFLPFFFAGFDIRTCFPNITNIIYFFMVIIYAILSLLCFVMALVLLHVCTEVKFQYERKPGIMQWWVIPKCYEAAAFTTFQNEIFVAERDNSIQACKTMLEICSPPPAYSINQPNKFFQCNIANPSQQCTSLENTIPLIGGVSEKTGFPGSLCNSSLPAGEKCTLANCATYCNNPIPKSYSADVVLALDYATRFVNASKVIFPLLNCDLLVDLVLSPFGSGNCETLRDGFFMLGAGTGVSYILFMFGMVNLFIGQKVFFKLPKDEKSLEMERELAGKMRKKKEERMSMAASGRRDDDGGPKKKKKDRPSTKPPKEQKPSEPVDQI